jgi:hypothetical protein
MPASLKFPNLVTASTWSNVDAALWKFVTDKRGKYGARTGRSDVKTWTPLLTNGDAATLIRGWLDAVPAGSRRELFPFWYQFAAVAYGWDPRTDNLIATPKQRDAFYPDAMLVELWIAVHDIATALEAQGAPSPRLDMDWQFDDGVFIASVVAQLQQDGAAPKWKPGDAEAAFKIPVPACKRPDGTIGPPRCKRVMKAWPYLCEEWEKCDAVVVDDPVTVVKERTAVWFWGALIVGVLYLMHDNKPRRRRRT